MWTIHLNHELKSHKHECVAKGCQTFSHMVLMFLIVFIISIYLQQYVYSFCVYYVSCFSHWWSTFALFRAIVGCVCVCV